MAQETLITFGSGDCLFKDTVNLQDGSPWMAVVCTDSLIRVVHRMAYSRFALSQWETSLQSNGVSHWLGASLESAQHWGHVGVKPHAAEPFMKLLAIDLSWNDNFFKEVHFVCLQSLLKLQGSIDQIVKGALHWVGHDWAMRDVVTK